MSPTAAANNQQTFPPGLEEVIYRGKWYKHKGIRPLCLLLIIALITSSTNDGSMMNGLQSVEVWQTKFNNPEGSTKGLLNANIGGLLGLPFAPYINDHFGRRAGILLGSLIMLAGVAMQATCNTISVFIGARGLIGFGLTFAQVRSMLPFLEVSICQRGALTSLFNSLWYSGNIVAAWTTFGTFRIKNDWAWRIPSILQALPSVVQVALIWFVPESPRWLISKGKVAQAQKILARYHTEDNNENDPVVQFEMNEIQTSLELERNTSVSWVSLVQTPGNRKRMRVILGIAFFSQWSGNGLVSYYLNDVLEDIGITSETIKTLYNGILAIYNLVIAVVASFYVDKLGRRTLFLWSTFGMTATWVLWTLCEGLYATSKNEGAGRAILAFIFVYYFFYDIAYSPLLVAYTVEITPFAMRAKVLALMNFFVSCSLIFNQYVNPLALDGIGWKYYLVYLGWLTKNLTLEETSRLFDGTDAVDEIVPDVHREGHHGEKEGLDEKAGDLQHVERA
ncbi:hexose transporter [Mrakia frigida]|uniref:hexose transporter n=1 Tax=Mrakia frigida TaxID=29902 RepID=UPI003FCBF0E9